MPFSSSFLLIILIILFENSSLNSEYQHQIIKANLGQTVTLSCLFDQDKIDQVSFMRQMTGDILSVGRELFVDQSSSNERIELKEISPNRLDLKLISVNENNSGIYTCMFNDEKLSSFLIQILIPPRFLSYYPMEGSISYNEGSSMNLSCHAFAIPSANITWIYRDLHKQTKSIHNGNDVYIPSIRSSDSGSYECIASNYVHASISRSFYVTVQYPPRLTIFNDENTYLIHDTVFIKCQICAIPKPTQIHWFRNQDLLIDINIIIKTQFNDQDHCFQSIVEIVDISEYQFGEYQCKAENNLGETSSYIHIEQRNNLILNKKFNENIRTGLLIDNKDQTLNITSTPQWLSDYSLSNKSSHLHYYSLIIIFILLNINR